MSTTILAELNLPSCITVNTCPEGLAVQIVLGNPSDQIKIAAWIETYRRLESTKFRSFYQTIVEHYNTNLDFINLRFKCSEYATKWKASLSRFFRSADLNAVLEGKGSEILIGKMSYGICPESMLGEKAFSEFKEIYMQFGHKKAWAHAVLTFTFGLSGKEEDLNYARKVLGVKPDASNAEFTRCYCEALPEVRKSCFPKLKFA